MSPPLFINFLKLGEKLDPTRVLPSHRALAESQWWSPQRLREHQLSKLVALLHHAYHNVPYYRECFDALGLKPDAVSTIEEVRRLPTLTKQAIRANFPEGMTAKNFTIKALKPQASGGSTGVPLRYYTDRAAYGWRLAAQFRHLSWAGFQPGSPWVRIGNHARHKVSERLIDLLFRCHYVHLVEGRGWHLERVLGTINRVKPVLIRGYVSPLVMLANHALQHAIAVAPVAAVVTTGEVLFPFNRALLESQFGAPVYDTYGGEGMAISGQCEKGTYHINDENVIVEFLDNNGEPAQPGQLAILVLTDLNNYGMPFIRYRIQDLAVRLEGGCACGRGLATMSAIQGRDVDIVVTPDGKYLTVYYFSYIIKKYRGIDQWQVRQTHFDRLEIYLVINADFSQESFKRIGDSIKETVGGALQLQMHLVEEIHVAESGKNRYVVSEIGRKLFGATSAGE